MTECLSFHDTVPYRQLSIQGTIPLASFEAAKIEKHKEIANALASPFAIGVASGSEHVKSQCETDGQDEEVMTEGEVQRQVSLSMHSENSQTQQSLKLGVKNSSFLSVIENDRLQCTMTILQLIQRTVQFD